MAQNNHKTPTPVPQAPPAQDNEAASQKAKKFSFSFGFLRKDNSNKEFAGKVAPSKRELEAQAAKRRAQRAKMQGGKHQPALSAEPNKEEAEEQLQPV